VFSPFVVNIVTTNPGGADHWEIMIAGDPLELDSTWVNYGGVAPGYGDCGGIIDNALVFSFPTAYGNNTTNECDDRCVNEICSTAAQEVGHVWRKMDHVRLASDPMTYFNYSYRRYFQNMEAQCGSDCGADGKAPSGQTCYGTGNESHTCWCTGETQNSYNIVKGLFGLGPGTPPITKITEPQLGDSVQQGFIVSTEISDDSGSIPRVEFKVDGTLVTTLTTEPFVFNAPLGLEEGGHHVEVIAYDPHGVAGTASVDVIIGPPCKSEDDCSRQSDVCVGGRCVPGPSVDGGLGTTCTDSTMCSSRACASDGTDSYCVEACRVGDCPDGFGCLDTGAGDGTGVCWPGYDDSGGCGCQTSRGGPAGMVFALLVMVLTCRRRRR
jgi:MYXO-CTERM domain-containing protein